MKYQNINDFLDFMVNSGKTPGNTIRVAVNNEVVHSYTAGYADLETKTKMTGHEKLFIYSCSKITAVTAAMQLLERGMYSMYEPLSKYIPEFKNMKVRDREGNLSDAQNPILIRHLFTMSAGMSYNSKMPSILKAYETTEGRMETMNVVRAIAEEPLDYEPGCGWRYSLAHDVLAGLVEVLSGMKYRDYVKKYIFEPLEMNDSYFHVNDRILSEMATLYCFVSDGAKPTDDIVAAQQYGKADKGVFVNWNMYNEFIYGSEYDSGGAGIITTADDYIKFLSALANFGEGMNGARILAPGTVDLMRTPVITTEQYPDFAWQQLRGFGYGYGVRTLMDKAKAGYNGSIGEFGWGGAAGSNCYVDPDRHIAIFYGQHCLNPREEYYQPRVHNAVYSCMY